jgi:hypothetical protein
MEEAGEVQANDDKDGEDAMPQRIHGGDGVMRVALGRGFAKRREASGCVVGASDGFVWKQPVEHEG